VNLFATVLTYPAPSANYRGESELNRTVIQKVTDGRFDYPIFSPESMRNALREILRGYGLPSNRERIHPLTGKGKSADGGDGDKQQLAVKYTEYPDPDKFIDDFFFGYLLAVKGKELDKLRQKKGDKFPLKRDSVLRMNLAKAVEPYRHTAVFTQSPQFAEGNPWKPGGGDAKSSSALLHRETVVSAFQYPFALSLVECKATPKWTRELLRAIGELNHVAGNHARSYFEMAPASIVVRLTKQLVAGYKTYGFTADGTFPEVIDGILHDTPEIGLDGKPVMESEGKQQRPKMKPAPDYPGVEFYVGGRIVKDMSADQAKKLSERGVTLDRDPRRLLTTVAEKFLGGE
jgi:CRISPR-associated protein Cst2